MDIIRSPVIEVRKTRIKEKKVLRGRLWILDLFYKNNTGNMECCKKYIVEYNELSK